MGKRKSEAREIPIKLSEPAEETSSDVAASAITDSDCAAVEAIDDGAVVIIESDEPFDPPLPPAAADESKGADDAEPSELESQLAAFAQEKAYLYDQLLRRQAEFENYRKRTDRERGEAYQHARAEVLLELLPVLDNFDRALSSLEQSGDDAEALHHGVELIHKQLTDALAKLGLQPLDSIGRAFDPNFHEAVTIEQTDEHAENTVIAEFERGYKLGDRLLRPAKVKVAASPER